MRTERCLMVVHVTRFAVGAFADPAQIRGWVSSDVNECLAEKPMKSDARSVTKEFCVVELIGAGPGFSDRWCRLPDNPIACEVEQVGHGDDLMPDGEWRRILDDGLRLMATWRSAAAVELARMDSDGRARQPEDAEVVQFVAAFEYRGAFDPDGGYDFMIDYLGSVSSVTLANGTAFELPPKERDTTSD